MLTFIYVVWLSIFVKIEDFGFEKGKIINAKYEVVEFLGKGWEGEVYLVRESGTGIERAAKFFYPHRNKNGKASKFYAKKLHKLRDCSILIQYATQDTYFIAGEPVVFLVSEYIEGELLSEFLKTHGRMHPFAALHFLHALADGIEEIHRMKEYHGDLHVDNIILQRVGLRYELKVIDLYHWGAGSQIKEDVMDMINVFYEVLGGKKRYSGLPQEVKDIICGLKRTLVLGKFKTAGELREYIENMQWN